MCGRKVVTVCADHFEAGLFFVIRLERSQSEGMFDWSQHTQNTKGLQTHTHASTSNLPTMRFSCSEETLLGIDMATHVHINFLHTVLALRLRPCLGSCTSRLCFFVFLSLLVYLSAVQFELMLVLDEIEWSCFRLIWCVVASRCFVFRFCCFGCGGCSVCTSRWDSCRLCVWRLDKKIGPVPLEVSFVHLTRVETWSVRRSRRSWTTRCPGCFPEGLFRARIS